MGGVQVSQQHVAPLMIAALAGAGAVFVLIVLVNHVSARGEVGVGRNA